MNQASFSLRGRNPDVLSCIANLSNDEVFTPPELANQMLDTLADAWAAGHNGANIWTNKNVRFLDPFTKSGVFLREIVKRLTDGLASEIPDRQTRVDHILKHQVFGIGITTLTSLLARRTLYCSKDATGRHSIATSFDSAAGNIWFERVEHTWIGHPRAGGRRCKYCGASEAEYGRGEELETHAYAFLHTDDIKSRIGQMFGDNMQFDVIIGNPPYQLSTEGYGTQARPIYHLFVEQAKAIEPKFLCMVIPSRWFSGGMGLGEFRKSMLNDKRLRVIEDFPDSNDVFVGTQIKGGVCYFLWDRDSPGPVTVGTHDRGQKISSLTRPLLEPGVDIFIRYNPGVSILKKVMQAAQSEESGPNWADAEARFTDMVSSIGAFGLPSTFRGRSVRTDDDVLVYRNGGTGYIARTEIEKEQHMIDEWKVFIPRAGSGSDTFPHSILGAPFVGAPGTISSWTYMYIGPVQSEQHAHNLVSYISTRFFRFLVLLHKPTQDATRAVYTFVPLQDFSRPWTDRELYEKYSLSEEEIDFIESMVRPMELIDE